MKRPTKPSSSPKKTKMTERRSLGQKQNKFKRTELNKPYAPREFDRKKQGVSHKNHKVELAGTSRSDSKNQLKPPREFFVWGRRIVESYLTQLKDKDSIDHASYTLHIIVDKQGKAPLQLKACVDLAKELGIKTAVHHDNQETWPLADASGDEQNHQRVCLRIPEFPVSDISEAENIVSEHNSTSTFGCAGIVLDQIQDPRNFGAIIRSAAFFGLKFVVYGTDRQADITPLVIKTSAGGAFHLNLIPVTNINRALKQLKDSGGWIVGTSLSDKTENITSLPKDRVWIAVMGNESKGLRQDVEKNCDFLVKIAGGVQTVDSLNVSVASGVVLHALNITK